MDESPALIGISIMTYRGLCEKISRHCHTLEKRGLQPEAEFWMETLRTIAKCGDLADEEVDAKDYLDRMANEREMLGLEPLKV